MRIIFLLCLLITTQLQAQVINQWTWMKGSSTSLEYGNYGTQGTAASSNTPGSRSSSATWVDSNGNLWLFGGQGRSATASGLLNDLWKYTPSTNQWTWVSGSDSTNQNGTYGTQGTASSSNMPGSRLNAVAWCDASDNLWLFGGNGYDASYASNGLLNDLWKFNTSTNEWTWVKGSNQVYQYGTYGTQGTSATSNTPGARKNGKGCIDASGNLWLFGGDGNAASTSGPLNCLWYFNTTTNQWTWMKGNNSAHQYGTYGTMGTAASANKPGGRYGMNLILDSSGNIWLFGGYGYGASGSNETLNDLWKYTPTTNNWTWMKGSTSTYQYGTYGTQGVASSSNTPGARSSAAFFADTAGNFWVFGGVGAASSSGGRLNDLWKLNTSTNEWTWMFGPNSPNQIGTYGTQGTAAATNKPGARELSVGWATQDGNFWIFGGSVYNGSGAAFHNDLWKIKPGTCELNASISSITNVPCYGQSTGSLTVTGSNTSGSVIYSWSGGGSTATKSSVAVGTYTVTITDATGCTATASATLTQPASAVSVSVGSVSNNACFGATNGQATASGSGGTGSISYGWSGGGSSATNTGMAAGTYTVTAADANGCTATATATITQPSAVAVSISSSTNVLCFGANTGQATANATGGTGSKSYAWSGGGSSATNTGLTAGSYTVTATDTNGCSATTSVTITQPSSAVSFGVSSVSNVLCNGQNSGSATVSGSGGSGSIAYSWTGGGSSATKSAMGAGTYTVTATDGNGCSATVSVTISQPSSAVSVSIGTVTHILCNGNSTGQATATGSGGTGTINYAWSGGGSNATKTAMAAGTYTVTATDANACTATATVNINQPSMLSTVITSSTNVSCFGGNNGQATVGVSGGTSAYAYSWIGGGSAATKTSLTAGTYTVTTTDANNCTATTSVAISQPSSSVSLSVSNVSNVLCFGESTGSATANGSGGTGSITYAWSGGGSGATNSTLGAGTYTITATDVNGCSATASLTITQPDSALSVGIVDSEDVLCFGDSTGNSMANGSGGTGALTYVWSNGSNAAVAINLNSGTFIVTVTDANNCTATSSVVITQPNSPVSLSIASSDVLCFGDSTGIATAIGNGGTGQLSFLWSNGSDTIQIIHLSIGSYAVTVTDSNGCVAIDSVVIGQPDLLELSVKWIDEICAGQADGSAESFLTGGAMPYGYDWSTGETTAAISDLAAGIYSVTCTDDNNCIVSDTFSVLEGNPPPMPSLGPDTLFTTSVTYTLTPGTYASYVWNDSSTLQTYEVTQTGTYWVQVFDSNGCSGIDSINITIWPTGIDQRSLPTYSVYPNPTHGKVNITHAGVIKSGTKFQLLDAQGQLLWEETVMYDSKNWVIDLNDFSQGFYILRIEIENNVETSRLQVF